MALTCVDASGIILARAWSRAVDLIADRYAVLTDILAGLPVIWRHYVKQRIFALIGDTPPDNGKASVKAAYLLLDQDPALKRSLIGG